MMIPEVGNQHSQIYLFVSMSEMAAIALSYLIGKTVKRVNAVAGTVIIIVVMSLASSFARVPLDCIENNWFIKTIYFLTLIVTI